ncbi:MAG: hypothetical protein ACYS7Y_31040 [Planctomycetota bacterium]|jgi:hypothetical protein
MRTRLNKEYRRVARELADEDSFTQAEFVSLFLEELYASCEAISKDARVRTQLYFIERDLGEQELGLIREPDQAP